MIIAEELTGPVEPLRIGVLGAARISELSIVDPAAVTGTRLVAVAARSRQRAEAFAETHGIERVHASYADVIADPEVEAVYNPLANSLHAPWNKAAILAGKHVLTEKPFASNGIEAAEVRDLVRGRPLVLFEGFHYLYHPLTKRLMSLLADGELGTLQHVESTMFMSAPPAEDPRWSLALAGGALMDLGCYALHAQRVLRDFAGGEPRLVGAAGGEQAGAPGVDAWAEAHLEFRSGATGLPGAAWSVRAGTCRCGWSDRTAKRSSPTSSTRSTTTGSSSVPAPWCGRSTAATRPPTPTSSEPSSAPSGGGRRTAPMPTTRS
ncbi:MAG: hypothetical protein QOF53_2176 [Nocardioidaceae bacterium]|nr:hypothetical protein [Nocardioidaceae bacterium]